VRALENGSTIRTSLSCAVRTLRSDDFAFVPGFNAEISTLEEQGLH